MERQRDLNSATTAAESVTDFDTDPSPGSVSPGLQTPVFNDVRCYETGQFIDLCITYQEDACMAAVFRIRIHCQHNTAQRALGGRHRTPK